MRVLSAILDYGRSGEMIIIDGVSVMLLLLTQAARRTGNGNQLSLP